MRPKDKIGQDITPGAFVCYAFSQWGSPTQKIGVVSSVGEKGRVTVWLVREGGPDGLVLNKNGTPTTATGRMVVVNGNNVPANYRALLEQVKIKGS